ncbi:uncharacterized protein LOC121796224 isoform X1 [Salvia splendens]|uniref:uncharacterized protein LOC121796224 isoform X1 n=1 Tax=Salvia splendens TaxID=180675 RepID=UPI001C26C4D4|nr:uncharacterized protein LOC121796224 isoform X1 [Salvia splendens]
MDVDSKPGMEETILVGDDLMMGPPSPIISSEIASHVLEGVDLCDGILRNLFLCLQINDIEPFCQDEIALYKQCAERRVGCRDKTVVLYLFIYFSLVEFLSQFLGEKLHFCRIRSLDRGCKIVSGN